MNTQYEESDMTENVSDIEDFDSKTFSAIDDVVTLSNINTVLINGQENGLSDTAANISYIAVESIKKDWELKRIINSYQH